VRSRYVSWFGDYRFARNLCRRCCFGGIVRGEKCEILFCAPAVPPYSAPLWLWSIIGGLYYLIFGFILFRLLRLPSTRSLGAVALSLILFMMVLNAITNYLIFRSQDLRRSFMVGAIFPFMDLALFVRLVQLDISAAWSLTPYLLYRIYAVWWGYKIWQLNDPRLT
jgi:tryptophan-rich sensory protein